MRSVLKNVERDLRILYEIASEEKLSFKLAVISAEFQKDFLLKELSAGRIEKLGPAPEVTEEAIRESTHIVAQMGVEPIIEALDRGADVVCCGRCYDPAALRRARGNGRLRRAAACAAHECGDRDRVRIFGSLQIRSALL